MNIPVDYEHDDFCDEDVFMRARRYACKQFDAAISGGKYQRHDINNATKIVGYLMRATTADEDRNVTPQEIGLAIERHRQEKLKIAE